MLILDEPSEFLTLSGFVGITHTCCFAEGELVNQVPMRHGESVG
jgi:hypothetical protein